MKGAAERAQPAPTRAGVAPAQPNPGAFARPSDERSVNPIIAAASTLLTVYKQTRHSSSHTDVAGLHRRIAEELRNFEQRLRSLGYKNEVVLSARYLCCVLLDEAVLNTPWGSNSGWAQRSLLSLFHNETSGGEKIFQILERIKLSPAEHIELIELYYLFLSLGLEGRYRVVANGKDRLENLRAELFETIRRTRGEPEHALADHWRGVGGARKGLTERTPLWVVLVVFAALIFFGFSGFRIWHYQAAEPTVQRLQSIASTEPNTQNLPSSSDTRATASESR
ncbi:type IVB secretion system protein IcmH/DotU [Agaribacterium haliotis]|uniref:type IVB secretion system protein IcmH/DotU n=1 Tax=Agaribacterium haliotis TaxID=2013869 RepID=UPI001EFE0ABB|nr:type IVB secretion system protein IcmH/DotU [Agaribacterium haliotis]